MPTRSLSPHLRPFGPHTYTKMKVEYPRRGAAPKPKTDSSISEPSGSEKLAKHTGNSEYADSTLEVEEEKNWPCFVRYLKIISLCLFACLFFEGGLIKNMFDVSSGGIKGARGAPPLGPLPLPPLAHLRRKWHKWAIFVNFFWIFAPIETHFPPQCPPQKIWCRHWMIEI